MTQRIVLVIGLVVLIVGTVAMLAGGIRGAQVIEEMERSFVVAPGQELFVQSQNGVITYEEWEGGELVIRATKESVAGLFPGLSRWFSDRVQVDISQTSRGVRAAQLSPMGWLFSGNVRVHMHVQAPKDWEGKISLLTSNGRISAKGLRGEAQLRTSNGAIVVEEQSGKLEASTSNGRIDLHQVDGAVQADTSNGPIRVYGGNLAQTGRFRTSNGTIELRAKLEQGANYEVRTSNGRVALTLVEPDVDVEIRTSNGDIDLNAEVAVREVGRNRLSGRIGQGSAYLNVRTSNGDVSLAAVNAPL